MINENVKPTHRLTVRVKERAEKFIAEAVPLLEQLMKIRPEAHTFDKKYGVYNFSAGDNGGLKIHVIFHPIDKIINVTAKIAKQPDYIVCSSLSVTDNLCGTMQISNTTKKVVAWNRESSVNMWDEFFNQDILADMKIAISDPSVVRMLKNSEIYSEKDQAAIKAQEGLMTRKDYVVYTKRPGPRELASFLPRGMAAAIVLTKALDEDGEVLLGTIHFDFIGKKQREEIVKLGGDIMLKFDAGGEDCRIDDFIINMTSLPLTFTEKQIELCVNEVIGKKDGTTLDLAESIEIWENFIKADGHRAVCNQYLQKSKELLQDMVVNTKGISETFVNGLMEFTGLYKLAVLQAFMERIEADMIRGGSQ